jgi:ABC-type branched-subunit amino acid transport system substrate-binding protein
MVHTSGIRGHASGVIAFLLLLAACGPVLAGCAFPGSVKPTVKIGLSAPFEGRYRDLGYEALHAVRLAVRQRNQAGGLAGRLLVELVALNDFGDPGEAVLQAREMNVDPGILGVVGGWSPETAQSAAPEYERFGIAFLVPDADFTGLHASVPAVSEFEAAYKELSGGVSPGAAAVWAYAATNRLLDAMDVAARARGGPTRAGVRKALSQ